MLKIGLSIDNYEKDLSRLSTWQFSSRIKLVYVYNMEMHLFNIKYRYVYVCVMCWWKKKLLQQVVLSYRSLGVLSLLLSTQHQIKVRSMWYFASSCCVITSAMACRCATVVRLEIRKNFVTWPWQSAGRYAPYATQDVRHSTPFSQLRTSHERSCCFIPYLFLADAYIYNVNNISSAWISQ
jgi:hypothetical protein